MAYAVIAKWEDMSAVSRIESALGIGIGPIFSTVIVQVTEVWNLGESSALSTQT